MGPVGSLTPEICFLMFTRADPYYFGFQFDLSVVPKYCQTISISISLL